MGDRQAQPLALRLGVLILELGAIDLFAGE